MISRNRRIPAIAVVVAAAAATAGCPGNGEGLDSNGRPIGPGGSPGGPLTPDFASIQANVFTPICSVCHAGANAPQGLRLDAANSYSLLVGVPSTEVPSILRVKPGDPANSYIIQKLQGIAAVGARMPYGQAPLPAATIQVISQWISDGALPASAASVSMHFDVARTVPADGETLVDAPAHLVVTFTHELDPTRVLRGSLQLRRVPVDGIGDGEEVAADVAIAAGNSRALVVTPRAPLGAGVFRVSLSSELGNVLADAYGNALPGAGAHGARSIAAFTVAAPP